VIVPSLHDTISNDDVFNDELDLLVRGVVRRIVVSRYKLGAVQDVLLRKHGVRYRVRIYNGMRCSRYYIIERLDEDDERESPQDG